MDRSLNGPLPIFHVDAFAERPFAGNPAAVCMLQGRADVAWMQGVAREMNLSETAFLAPAGDGWRLRWFTPVVEVDLCGHATLASAHVLWETEHLAPDETARFHTKSGLLTARRRGRGIDLDFPAASVRAGASPPELVAALGLAPIRAGRTPLGDWLVEVEDAAAVRRLAPDMARLRRVPARGIVVTAGADDQARAAAGGTCDFVSRFFAPATGIDEDPVTGSAHCSLGPYWAERLGRDDLVGYQASARGGVVGVRVAGDRVVLSGRAVTVLRGEWTGGGQSRAEEE